MLLRGHVSERGATRALHSDFLVFGPYLGVAMDVLDLSRWQFGITTVYHFILVPLTIGLAPLIAIIQTM